MGQRYQRQLAEVERCRVQRQLAAQTEEPHVRLCEPLCGLLRGGAVSLPPEKDFKPFSSRFSGGSSDSAEDKNRVPAEAQRSGFGGKRRRSGMSEFSPLSAETRDMELAPTRSRMKISKPGRELRFF